MTVGVSLCSFPDCGRFVHSTGLCQAHYRQQRLGQELRPVRPTGRAGPAFEVCSFPDCGRHGKWRGLCEAHAKQRAKGQELRPLWTTKNRTVQPCVIEGCDKPASGKGLCLTHRRYELRGTAREDMRPIRRDFAYRYVNSDSGYVDLYRPDHPNARPNGRVLEHIAVMADHLGRRIRTDEGENVHHRNGERGDNRLENLELWVRRQPPGQRVTDLVAYARWVLATYEDDAAKLTG